MSVAFSPSFLLRWLLAAACSGAAYAACCQTVIAPKQALVPVLVSGSRFADGADQNMVILIDGVRLSKNELSVALLASVPIETVVRIEIVRGGSSLLYGEGATAGTIQVITKRARLQGGVEGSQTRGTMVLDAGSSGNAVCALR